MNATDDDVAPFDVTRTLRDVAQHRLRRTTTIGEALYHQATAKAAALAILAEIPEAAYLELDESDQEGSNFSPGAILAADGTVLADDSFGSAVDMAERWNNVMDLHYGPLTDLPDEYEYDNDTREAVPPYPWLVTVENGDSGRIGRLDVRAAAEIDLAEAVAAAFPTEALPDLPHHLPGRRQLTGEEIAALAIDAVVLPAALIDTGARHHVPLPEWLADRGAPSVTGERTSDGVTHLTVSTGGFPLLTVRGTWNGERYGEEYAWHADYLTLNERDQVEAWAQSVWVRLTDSLDNVVDHAIAAILDPVLARIATDYPTPSADVLADLSARGVAVPSTLPPAAPSSPSLAEATRDLPVGSKATLGDLNLPELPGFSQVTLHKASENSYSVDAVVQFTGRRLNELLTAACGLDVDFAWTWIADNRETVIDHLTRRYEARWTPSPADSDAGQVGMTVTGIPATTSALGIGDHLYGDPNVRAFLDEHHSGGLWRDLAAATGLPVADPREQVPSDDAHLVFANQGPEPPHPTGPAA